MIKLFGTTFKETIAVLTEEKTFGSKQSTVSKEDKIKTWARIIITILLIGVGVFCIIADKTDIGGTILGAITGYWFR